MLSTAPIGIAQSVSYRSILPFRIVVLGFPLSVVDISVTVLAALGFSLAPTEGRRQISPLGWSVVAVTGIGVIVGLVHVNDFYYFARDLRSAIYLFAGVYLAGLARFAPDPRAPLRLLVLLVLVSSAQQWLHFLGGMAYGREAMLAGAGLLRDATIYQYGYGLAFGAIGATFATKRRLFDDRLAFVLMCTFAATVSISLTRSAWLSFALTGALVVLIPTKRLWSARLALVSSMTCVILPWIALALLGSPFATLPAARLSTSAEGVGVLQQIESPQPQVPGGNPTPAPTLTARLSMVATALDELQRAAATDGAAVWLFGFGYGHNLASYTFPTGDVAIGVTDLENTAAQLLWKTGIAGALIALTAIITSAVSTLLAYLRTKDPLVGAWLAAVVPLLALGLVSGLTPAPYSMVLGGWLGLSAVFMRTTNGQGFCVAEARVRQTSGER